MVLVCEDDTARAEIVAEAALRPRLTGLNLMWQKPWALSARGSRDQLSVLSVALQWGLRRERRLPALH